jgi:MoaA/NifB/PqqE/SkfB family radical SAM enzyme
MEVPAFPWLEPEAAAGETVALRNVFLHVTKACNLRCDYCYFSASRPLPGEMTAAELGPLWPELVDFFAITATRREDYLRRYQGVIHLQTAAIGAGAYYRRAP